MVAPPTSPADPVDLRVQLHGAGLRVTGPRLAVLGALTEQPHSDADTVFQRVRTGLGGTSVQAVYGVLRALTDAGLVRRIEPAGSAALYERRVGDNHHHLVCRSCGSVTDIDCAVGDAPCLDPGELAAIAPGFHLEEAEVTFWGICASCSTRHL